MDIENEKEPESNKKKTEMYIFLCMLVLFSTSIPKVIDKLKQLFHISWVRVQMYYHRFKHLAQKLNGGSFPLT